ncbi:MAG: VWA domain-containing protein, partial [Bacteroidales bacterium]|nr:VWA domain-containing protein [Bacteroidales bacterium]
MKKIYPIVRFSVLLLMIAALSFCKRDVVPEDTKFNFDADLLKNPTPVEIGKIPDATVKLLDLSSPVRFKDSEIPLTPVLLETSLKPGESITETKTANISSAPPLADILFLFDLTGSMGGELSNVKANSSNIMMSIASIIDDAAFGLITHMDYVGYYSYCGYSSTYGDSYYGDYPYLLDQPITSEVTQVMDAINSKVLGYGADNPESYTRALYETAADPSIGWRSGARKFVVAWLDNVPHDCTLGTGVDPGRDGIAGTDDDLAMDDIISAMAAQNITLIVLNSGGDMTLWQGYASSTPGGVAYQINSDGSIPGGIDIATYIASIIQNATETIDKVTLEVCTSGYEDWLTILNPESYTSVSLVTPFTGTFNITLTVPEGTEGGVHEFDICLVGDGAVYGRQHVIITVPGGVTSMQVPVDVLPRVCPNAISRYKPLLLTIVGFEGLDVTNIDPSTVRLEGIEASEWIIKDLVGPFYPFVDKALDASSCNITGPDGYNDLVLKFDWKKLWPILSEYEINQVVRLSVTGYLLDGTMIQGEDIV